MECNKFFVGLLAIFIAYIYSLHKNSGEGEEIDEDDYEEIVFNSWNSVITSPKEAFSRVAIGWVYVITCRTTTVPVAARDPCPACIDVYIISI